MRCLDGNIHKKQNEQQETIASNKRHLPVLVFELELILKNKKEQRRAAKGTERQMETRTKKPKRATKATKAFFIAIFIHSHQFWTYGRWLVSRATKSQKNQRRERKSNEKQQKATKSNEKQQRTSELEKPKQARRNQEEQRKVHKVQMETRLYF